MSSMHTLYKPQVLLEHLNHVFLEFIGGTYQSIWHVQLLIVAVRSHKSCLPLALSYTRMRL